jgi:hypothetical protein
MDGLSASYQGDTFYLVPRRVEVLLPICCNVVHRRRRRRESLRLAILMHSRIVLSQQAVLNENIGRHDVWD